MAATKAIYFSGTEQVKDVFWMPNDKFEALFPGVKGVKVDSFKKWAGHPISGTDKYLPVTRIIHYKQHPSLHKCDARCMHAKGRVCECSCGGANHGIGG